MTKEFINVRTKISVDTHSRLKAQAALAKKSWDEWLVIVLDEAAKETNGEKPKEKRT